MLSVPWTRNKRDRHETYNLFSRQPLSLQCPVFFDVWDNTMNNKTPEEVRLGDGESYWWRCECGDAWQATVNQRISGNVHRHTAAGN